MSEPLAYLAERFVPRGGASLALHDAGFVSGATVADFCRTVAHRPFRLADHLARFRRDCESCGITLSRDDATIERIIGALVEHNAGLIAPEGDLAIITFATPGPIGYYLGQPPIDAPTFGVHTFPLPLSRYVPLFTEGATLLVAGFQPRGDILPPGVKHRSRMLWWLADRRVKQRADSVAGALPLLLDAPDGNVLETSFANVLFVFDGVVTSPPVGDVLDGIGLRVVRELCEQCDILFVERTISLTEAIGRSSEALITGTAFGVAGVSCLESRSFDWPGPITSRLVAEFAGCADFDISGQILAGR